MSMNILRATKLKYGAIHSAEPKQMWVFSLDYVGYLHSLAVRTGIGKKLLVRELARELVFFSIPKYNILSSREVNERLLESDSSRANVN